MAKVGRWNRSLAGGAAGIMLLVMSGIGNAMTENDLRRYWENEYQDYEKRIENYPSAIPSEQMYDPQARILESDATPCDVILRRTEALLEHSKTIEGAPSLATRESELSALRERARSGCGKDLFYEVAALRRSIALANPLLDFEEILFVKRTARKGHMCDSRFGFHWGDGEGIFLLKNPFDSNDEVFENIIENSTVENGRFQGQTLAGGGFMGPDLSFDGQEIVFAWVQPGTNETSFTKERTFHIFKVNVDGTGLTQLTDGPWNEFDPCWLPNGRIAFISERRGGFGRCHGKRVVPTYTLYSMKPDGEDIICLSYHETNEWTPSVDNDGMIVYTRWDYVDRDSDIAHHLWTCYPDGRDPRAPHGNYPYPWSTIGPNWKMGIEPGTEPLWSLTSQYENYDDIPGELRCRGDKDPACILDGRAERPWGEWNIRAIPNSRKYVATAGAHHSDGGWFGTFVIIDPSIPDDNVMSQLKRVTEDGFPESEKIHSAGMASAWPLSEDFFLHSGNKKIALLDRFGNDIVLGRMKYAFDPIPLKSRPRPPIIPKKTNQGEDGDPDGPRATISVVDIYNSDMEWPENTDIKWMRIIQVIPQSVVPSSTRLVRMPLGVVPVEEDGSVYCEAPVGCEIYFQALDEYGMAVQSMRSGTYVHTGEHLSCAGCHEDKWDATPPPSGTPIALSREPSKIVTESPQGAVPFNRFLLVDPVVENTCKPCHDRHDRNGPDLDEFKFSTTGNGAILGTAKGGSRTIPGVFGARITKVGQALRKKIHQDSVPAEDLRRIALWLDCNSMDFGVYTDEGREKQKNGEIVWPLLDVDPENPLSLDSGPDPVNARIAEQIGFSAVSPDLVVGRIDIRKGSIQFVSSNSGRHQFMLYGMDGRLIQSEAKTTVAQSVANFGLEGIVPGIYLLRVRGPSGILSRRVSLLH